MQVITVYPAEPGWRLQCSLLAGDLMFRSGFAAERTARHLGEAFASCGQDAEIRIHLRDGSLAARFACPAVQAKAVEAMAVA